MPFLHFCDDLNFEFMNFYTFWMPKFTKFRGHKMVISAVLDFLDSPKLISRKISGTEESRNLHTSLSVVGKAKCDVWILSIFQNINQKLETLYFFFLGNMWAFSLAHICVWYYAKGIKAIKLYFQDRKKGCICTY